MPTLAPSQNVIHRDPQGLKFMHIVEAAYDKAGLSDNEAQRVNDAPGLAELVGDFIAGKRQSDQFKNEEVASTYVYPSGYAIVPIRRQIDILMQTFGLSLGYTHEFMEKVFPKLTLPDWAEGWFAIPSVDALAARFFPNVKDPAARYSEAVKIVLAKIAKSRSFYNYREGQIEPSHYRMNARTALAMDLIMEQQKGDILVVPGQFGLRHRGRSVRRAREVMTHPEFGLGAVGVGSMLLTHPKRLVSFNDLWIDVPGDEFSYDGGGQFGSAPYFHFRDDGVRFDANVVDDTYDHYGSASASVPQ